jgi:hypothetical protein
LENTGKRHVKIRCPKRNCGYTWNYGGQFLFYATCPQCRKSVKISENKVGVTAI